MVNSKKRVVPFQKWQSKIDILIQPFLLFASFQEKFGFQPFLSLLVFVFLSIVPSCSFQCHQQSQSISFMQAQGDVEGWAAAAEATCTADGTSLHLHLHASTAL